MLFIGDNPIAFNLVFIHSGDSSTFIPEIVTPAYLGQAPVFFTSIVIGKSLLSIFQFATEGEQVFASFGKIFLFKIH